MKPLFTTVLIMLLLLIIASNYSAFFAFANEKEKAVTGDAIIQALLAEPSTMLPFLASDSGSRTVSQHLYVSLLKYDKNLTVVPNAAEDFQILDGGLRLRFSLHPGIFWQDGVEVTADDVEFTYKLMIDPNNPTPYSGDFKAITQFRKLSKYAFEVVYDKPFTRSLSTWMSAIMPKHVLEGQNVTTSPLNRAPISCGPYIFESWVPGVSITLRANANYFKGRPHIDTIVYRFIPDMSTMFLELKAQKLDIIDSMNPLQYLSQAILPEFKKEFSTYKYLSSSYTYLGYNLKSKLFTDKRVRQAFAYAIKKDDIIKGVLMGQGLPTIGPFKPDMWAYNKKIQNYPYDVTKALALLEEAGWKKASSGQLMKDGEPFIFTLLVNQGNESRAKVATIIQSQLRPLGITVKIRAVEWSAFIKQFVEPGFFDAVILAWNLPADPDSYDVWHSSGVGGRLNYIGYSNKEADQLLEEGRTTFDEARRKILYDRFQEILHEEQPYCFLYVPYALVPVQKRFHGIELAPAGIMYNFNDWWVPADEQRYKKVFQ